jgi:anti-sigma-K factor RskA
MSEKHDNGHERWLEQAAAYSLGSLDRNEVPEFERHLEGCENCRSEIRWLKPAVDALPESVPLLEPPPQLRERILKEATDEAGTGVAAAGEGAGERLSFGAWLSRLGSGSRGWKPLAGVAAAAIVVVAFVGFEVGSNGGSANDHSNPPVAQVVIPAPLHPEGIHSKVVLKGERATVHLADVKKLPDNRVLEAWVLRDEKVEPVKALFVPDRHGNASTEIDDMRGVETVMVTREPQGGSPSPTGTPIATVPIKSS